ncbi:MAG: regulator of sigma E protease, partial [Myxococcota bacterium]
MVPRPRRARSAAPSHRSPLEAALYIVLMIGGLIFFHELGHYVLARLMGVHVVEFSIGFGPKLFTIRGKKRHPALPPTEFVIGALPIGGYVRMLGAEPGEDIADDIRDVALNFKPVWRRFLIAAAGPAFNLILPFIIFFIFGLLTTEKLPSVIGDVSPGTPAFDAGLRAGDRITGIDGEEVAYW